MEVRMPETTEPFFSTVLDSLPKPTACWNEEATVSLDWAEVTVTATPRRAGPGPFFCHGSPGRCFPSLTPPAPPPVGACSRLGLCGDLPASPAMSLWHARGSPGSGGGQFSGFMEGPPQC